MALKRVFHSAAGLITGRWRQSNRYIGRSEHLLVDVTTAKSGFVQLDRAIGIGGLPQGRLIELIGPDTGGGLSIVAKIAAKFQRRQRPVAILDAIGQFELAHAVRCGLVAPELLLRVPQNALELVYLTETAARQRGLIIIYLGFIPRTFASVPEEALASLLKRLSWITSHSEAVFLYVTLLEDVDPFIHTNYLPGFPLNDVADIRLWVQDEGWIRKEEQIGGYRGNITVVKNTLAASGKGANIRIPFVDLEITRLADELGF